LSTLWSQLAEEWEVEENTNINVVEEIDKNYLRSNS
jgi:hypothetical protein